MPVTFWTGFQLVSVPIRDPGVIFGGILVCFYAGSRRDLLQDPGMFPCGVLVCFSAGLRRDLQRYPGMFPYGIRTGFWRDFVGSCRVPVRVPGMIFNGIVACFRAGSCCNFGCDPWARSRGHFKERIFLFIEIIWIQTEIQRKPNG